MTRPHVGGVVQNFLQQQNVNLLDWPVVSPVLSPIGHLWDEMDRTLRRLPNPPVTLAKLGPALVNIVNNILQAFVRDLVSSIRQRCVACIDAMEDITVTIACEFRFHHHCLQNDIF